MAAQSGSTTWVTPEFFARDTLTVARDLIGTRLVVGRCSGRIVETEAYTDDAASHFVMRRHRATLMRETCGRVYVYLIYGMYHCLNFTTDATGPGAVLIRAIEPLTGLATMQRRRGQTNLLRVASGPGRLCQALAIDLRHDGQTIGRSIKLAVSDVSLRVITGPRIGISRAMDLPWRFYAAENPHVSRGPRKNSSPAG